MAEPGGLTIRYADIATFEDFYSWGSNVLSPGIFSSMEYSVNREVITLKYNQVGGIRFRQVRIRPDSCSVLNYKTQEPYSKAESQCYSDYSPTFKSQEAYSIGLQPCEDQSRDCIVRQAFRYTEDIPNSSSVRGKLASYGADGFYLDSVSFLSDGKLEQSELLEMFKLLQASSWLDLQTRAVIITFLTWNSNYEYFSQVQFLLEFGASSVFLPSYSIQTFNILPFMSSWKNMQNSFSGFMLKFPELYIFTFAWLGLAIPMIYAVVKKGIGRFLMSMWNYVDLTLFLLMQAQMIVKIYLYFAAAEIQDTLDKKNFNVFLNFNTPLLAIWVLANVESYATLIAALKLLSYFKLSSMTMIWDTLERGSRSIFAFMIILALLLNAFTQMSHIVYGRALQSFSTYFYSFINLFRMLLGDISRYPDMSDAEPNFTPFIFIGYIFLCFFVMLNIFVAILNEAFGVVVDYRQQHKDKLKMQKFGKKVLEELTFYWKKTANCVQDCWVRSKQQQVSKTLRQLRN